MDLNATICLAARGLVARCSGTGPPSASVRPMRVREQKHLVLVLMGVPRELPLHFATLMY